MLVEDVINNAMNAITSPDPKTWEIGYYGRLFDASMRPKVSRAPVMQYEYKDRDKLYSYAHEKIVRSGPIDFFEFGVFQGESFRKWLSINQHPESRFFGFDCFEGLPTDWESGNCKKGAFTCHGRLPDISDPRATFIKGLFNETLADFLRTYEPRNRLVIHMDADLFASTMYVLMQMDPFVKRGTLILFDDFNPRDDFAAFHNYTVACQRDWDLVAAREGLGKLAVVIAGKPDKPLGKPVKGASISPSPA